jgi:hypothetical protein
LTTNGETFQNNYLSKYDIKNNLWLLLLYTIHHLGANKIITKHIKTTPKLPLDEFDIREYVNTKEEDPKKSNMDIQFSLIKDYYLTVRKIVISSARVIILAASTENGKEEQVKQTFIAAQSLARLTGNKCPEYTPPIITGGGYDDFNYLFKKSYRNYINGLNKNYKQKILK